MDVVREIYKLFNEEGPLKKLIERGIKMETNEIMNNEVIEETVEFEEFENDTTANPLVMAGVGALATAALFGGYKLGRKLGKKFIAPKAVGLKDKLHQAKEDRKGRKNDSKYIEVEPIENDSEV